MISLYYNYEDRSVYIMLIRVLYAACAAAILNGFVFFFRSFTNLFSYLKWRNAEQVKGQAFEVKEDIVGSGRNAVEISRYKIAVEYEGSQIECIYEERWGKNHVSSNIKMNEPMDFYFLYGDIITADEFNRKKKNLWVYPITWLASIVFVIAIVSISVLISMD